MKANKLISEYGLYWLAFLLAAGLRFYQLGASMLSESEAGWALQALGIAHGSAVVLDGQPAYILLTSLLFSIIKSTNFLARFIPALAGSLIVWLPYYFRRWMGEDTMLHRAGLVMAFGLAIDPGLVSISRQVGSPMTALAFSLLALACLYNRRMIWLGITTALAVLSGTAFLQGLLVLGLSLGLYLLVRKALVKDEAGENEAQPPSQAISASSIRVAVVAFLITLLAAGTLFLRVPQGLGALADMLSSYLSSFVSTSGIPFLRLPASLLVYQLLVVIFAVAAALRAWLGKWENVRLQRLLVGLSLWAIVAVILPVFYAGRQVSDLSWALIPLWALAATEISRAFLADEDIVTRLVAAGLGVFLFLMAIVLWMNLLPIGGGRQSVVMITIGGSQVNVVVNWLIILGTVLLAVVAVLLIIAGWSSKAAQIGVVWSLCAALGLFLLANTWGMAIVRQNGAQELWSTSPTLGQSEQFMTTLSDLSSWNTGMRDQLEVVSLYDSPALQWELRDFPYARFESSLSNTESPPVVITVKGTEELALAQQYRGQDFVWKLSPGWQGAFPPNFINWLAFRQAPLSQEQVILWARSDIFPGGGSTTTGSTLP
jgi:hypothetical protein